MIKRLSSKVMHKLSKRLKGRRFGKLKAVRFCGRKRFPSGGSTPLWLCLCDCGNKPKIPSQALLSGNSKSCGCGRVKTGPFGLYFLSYKRSAQKRKHIFSLTRSRFDSLIVRDCFYCGASPGTTPFKGKYSQKYSFNGVDRKNPKKGYTVRNCVPCCKTCNFGKANQNQRRFYLWIGRVYARIPS
jgi:hypothetical protein